MGCQDGTHNDRVWDVKNKSITKTRDVVFTNITPTPSETASTIESVITPIPASKQNDVEEVERLDVDNIQDNVQQQPDEEEDESDDPLSLRSLGHGGADSQSFVAHAHAVDTLPKSYNQARHSREWRSGSLQCKKNWQRWRNTKSGTFRNNGICE